MRSRNIKPGFFKNELLVSIPVETRLLFIGLWCLADRMGRLEDRPARIKMEIYPCDNYEISTMLDQLQHHAFILRYEAKGNRYIQIINFEKHQYPHMREKASTIPAPCKTGASTMPARLNPSYLNPESCITDIPPSGAFDLVWGSYPRKDGRRQAERSFMASVKTEKDWQDIQAALKNYLASDRVKNGFIKNGSTWFNNWRDWIEYTETKPEIQLPSAKVPEWQY